ncbi:MAG TPA: hypothetical protein VIF57_24715, partial [Polyangia bacterium]
IAAIVGAALVGMAGDRLGADRLGGSLAALTLLVAIVLIAVGAARISFLPRLFPEPVFVGYIAGTGALAIPDASARTALLRAQQELAARGIRMELGNTREEVRRALHKVGALNLIDEAQFLADLHRLHPSPVAPAPADTAPTPASGH